MKLFFTIFFTIVLLFVGSASAQTMIPPLTSVLSPLKKPLDGNGKNFDILIKLLVTTGLDKVLAIRRGITIFAPNDAALVATVKERAGVKGMLTEARVFAILQGIAKKGICVKRGSHTVFLKNNAPVSFILTYHVLPLQFPAQRVLSSARFTNTHARKTVLATASLEIVDKSKTMLNPVVIRQNLMFRGNVIVHVINRVLLPL